MITNKSIVEDFCSAGLSRHAEVSNRLGILTLSVMLILMLFVAGNTSVNADTHTFDFTNWSQTTLDNCDADAAHWCIYENTKSHPNGENEGNANNGKGKYLHSVWEKGPLTANGITVAETVNGTHTLQFSAPEKDHAFGLMTDLGSAMGTYRGSSFLWLTSQNNSTIYIPSVKCGTTLKLGLESHKLTEGEEDARGVKVFYGSEETLIGTYTTTTFQEIEVSIPGTAGDTDIKLVATKGCHLYYIDCELYEPVYHTVTYTNGGDASILGILPTGGEVEEGKTFTVGGASANRTLYKEGYTLTGWSDGTTTYPVGTAYTMLTTNVTLTPVFTANTHTLAGRSSTVTVNYGLCVNEGAPNVTWQSNNYNYLVYQAEVDGETQDFAAKIKGGKYAPSNNGSDAAQINDNTTITIPAVTGTSITVTTTSGTPAINVSASDLESTAMSVSGKVLSYTYRGTASEIVLTINGAKQYFSSLSVTYPAIPPSFTSNLASQYTVAKDKPLALSINAVEDITTYQWYTCADNEGTNAEAITGANSSTYNFSSDTEATYYLYCTATNPFGTTRSNIATVSVSNNIIFDFRNWASDDLTIKTLSTENGKVTRDGGANINPIYETDYPYSLRGYMGFMGSDIQISNTNGLTNNKSNASRGAAVLALNSGDKVVFTGTDLSAEIFNSTTDNGRGTCTVSVNDAGTEATVTMTSAGNLAFYLKKNNTQNIYTITTPVKAAPSIATDLPLSYTATVGESRTLTIEAVGENLAYQWYHNGTTASNKGGEAIEGATTSSYTIDAIEQTGVYYCLVTNTVTNTCVASSAEQVIINPVVTFQCDEMEGIAAGGTVKGRVPYATSAAPALATLQLNSGESVTIPTNQTLYKPGYTLRYWTPDNGTTKYYPGTTYPVTTDVTLKPYFQANAVSLTNSGSEVSVTWQLGKGNGAPSFNNEAGMLVTQTTIDGISIDLCAELGGSNYNYNRTDQWMQFATASIPVVKNTMITLKIYEVRSGSFTVNGEDFLASDCEGSVGNLMFYYTYTGDEAKNITINCNRDYVAFIKADYPATAALAVDVTPSDLRISDAKVKYQTAKVMLTGNELPSGRYNVQLLDAPSSLTVSPVTFKVDATGNLAQEFIITYNQQEVQADGVATFKVIAGSEQKSIGINYGRSVAYSGTTPDIVTSKQVWDWSAASADIKPTDRAWTSFCDLATTGWPSGISSNYQYLEGTGDYFVHATGKGFNGNNLQFTTSMPGVITVEFSNVGSSTRPYRYLTLNGEVLYDYKSNNLTRVVTDEIRVPAGQVLLQGSYGGDSLSFGPQYLRIYKVTFVPDAVAPTIGINRTDATFTLSNGSTTDEFYYTLDGSVPTVMDGIKYVPNLDGEDVDQGVHLNGSCTIRAIAVDPQHNKNNSEVSERTARLTTYKLVAEPSPSSYGFVEYEPATSDNSYTKGSHVTLRAVAKPGYGFEKWSSNKQGTDNLSTEYTYSVGMADAPQAVYAIFSKGLEGTVKYDLSGLKILPADDSYTISDDQLALIRLDANIAKQQLLFPDITTTAIHVPSDYPLYLGTGGYTLQYWEEKDHPENKFYLGESQFFTDEKRTITLIPVFKMNPGSTSLMSPAEDLFDRRTKEVSLQWDFRTAYGAQSLDINGKDADYADVEQLGVYNHEGVPFATQTAIDAQYNGVTYTDVAVDVPMVINAADGSFRNTDIDTWSYMTEGTEIVVPSGYGAVFTLATYGPIKDTDGTTLNGMRPDNIFDENLKKDASGAYLYQWTVTSTELTAKLRIGSDYSYYEYLKADLPAAQYKYLNISTNNKNMGTVHIATIGGEETEIGTAFTNGTTVTVNASRTHFYELKYWQTGDGFKIYPDGSWERPDGTKANTSWDGTTPFTVGTASSVHYSAVSSESISFELTDYLTLTGVFGEKKNFYVDFSSSGGDVEGLPPSQQHVEYDEMFTMPAHNQHMYLDGFTLDYYTDRNGNRYDFNTQYLVTDETSLDGKGILLTPHFRANTVALTDVSQATTVTWSLQTQDGGRELVYRNSMGVLVDQAVVGNETIDVPLYIDASNSSANVNNTSSDDRCTFAQTSVFTMPATKGCVIMSHSRDGSFTSTLAAGATSKNSYSEGGEVVTAKYTSGKDLSVTYNGTQPKVSIVSADKNLTPYYVSVTYQPLSGKPELTAVMVGETPVSDTDLEALKANFTLSGIEAEMNYAENTTVPVSGTASNGGRVVVTQATPTNPVATLLLQTDGGTTVGTYTITLTPTGIVAPTVLSAAVSGIATAYDGSESVDAGENGVVKIYFDHAMQNVSTTAAMMTASDGSNGQSLTGTANTEVKNRENVYSVSLPYWGLTAGVTYTLTIPAGTFLDEGGQAYNSPVVVKFIPQAREAVTPKLFNFVVTHKQLWDAETQTAGARIQTVSDEVLENIKTLGSVQYGTIDEATNAANAKANDGSRFYIFVPDGEYCMKGNEAGKFTSGSYKDYKWTGGVVSNNKTAPAINIADYAGGFYNGRTFLTKSNISIVGQSQDKTILYNDPYIYGISYTSTIEVRNKLQDCYFQDLTLDNRFSKYQVEAGNSNPGGQSAAFYDRGIHTIMKNVKMMGYQDTYVSGSSNGSTDFNDDGTPKNSQPGMYLTRRYYENCSVGGTVDFVCGSGDDWWEEPTFIIRSRSTANNIVAARHMHPYMSQYFIGDDYMFTEKWGYVFNNGRIVAEDEKARRAQEGKYYIGRVWNTSPAMTFLGTTYAIAPADEGWTNMSFNLLCRAHEYGSFNADGQTLADLTKRTLRAFSPLPGSDDCILTAEQAAQYTMHNVLGGEDGYDPTIYTKQVNMNGVKPHNITDTDGRTLLTWEGKNDALCYFIFTLDEVTNDTVFFSMASINSFVPDAERDKGRVFLIRAANERGGLGLPSDTVRFAPLDTYELVVSEVIPGSGMGWATVCLPVNTTFIESQEEADVFNVYAAIKVQGTDLYLKKISSQQNMMAGRGYIIYAKPGKYRFYGTYNSVAVVAGNIYSLLDGNSQDHAVSVGSQNIYTLAYKPLISENVGFYRYVAETIPAYKAYLRAELLGDLTSVNLNALSNGSKGMRFIFLDVDEDFDFENTTGADAVREMSDDNSPAVFDLSGKAVDSSQMRKGQIYIIGGRKVMY